LAADEVLGYAIVPLLDNDGALVGARDSTTQQTPTQLTRAPSLAASRAPSSRASLAASMSDIDTAAANANDEQHTPPIETALALLLAAPSPYLEAVRQLGLGAPGGTAPGKLRLLDRRALFRFSVRHMTVMHASSSSIER
jgi:hypothetical protein